MPRILIVDDEESMRFILFEFLSLKGYDCTLAADAEEAKKRLKSNSFDLVLSDLNMPGESGLELLRYVFSEYSGTVGIILTAISDSEIKERALEIGISTYLTKPFRLDELLDAIAKVLPPRDKDLEVLHPTCSLIARSTT